MRLMTGDFKLAPSIQWCHHSWLQPVQILFIGQTPGCDKSIYDACLNLAQLCKLPHPPPPPPLAIPSQVQVDMNGPTAAHESWHIFPLREAECNLFPPLSHCSQRCLQITFFLEVFHFFFFFFFFYPSPPLPHLWRWARGRASTDCLAAALTEWGWCISGGHEGVGACTLHTKWAHTGEPCIKRGIDAWEDGKTPHSTARRRLDVIECGNTEGVVTAARDHRRLLIRV